MLGAAMISRAIEAGVPAGWVAGDEVYGADPALRATVRGHQLGYVLQVAANRRVPTDAGPMCADALAATVPDSAWQAHSAGAGSKGHSKPHTKSRKAALTVERLSPRVKGRHESDVPRRRVSRTSRGA